MKSCWSKCDRSQETQAFIAETFLPSARWWHTPDMYMRQQEVCVPLSALGLTTWVYNAGKNIIHIYSSDNDKR